MGSMTRIRVCQVGCYLWQQFNQSSPALFTKVLQVPSILIPKISSPVVTCADDLHKLLATTYKQQFITPTN